MNSTQLLSSDLYQYCSIEQFKFSSTSELETLPTMIGQSRALEAVDFGINIEGEGYNLYVMGPNGSGKYTLVKRFLDEHVKHRQQAQDWAYFHNFIDPQNPWAIALPAGQGKQLRHDIETIIQYLEEDLPHAVDDEYYRGRIRAIDESARQHRVRLFGALQTEADKHGVVLLRMQDGSYAFAAKRDGEPLTSDEFEQLPLEQQEQTEQAIATLHEDMQHTLLELKEWERGNLKKVADLNTEVTNETITRQLNKLKHAYPNSNELQKYFDAMQEDIKANIDAFIDPQENSEDSNLDLDDSLLRRYQINLIVDNSAVHGAPVVYENLPNHQSLLGCVENMAMMGALITDFSLIKAGALHRANGGYLILDAEQLLMQPYAWDGLKRALLAKELQFDTLERMYSLVSTVSLEPEPIPLDLKVILLGDRHLYYQLYELDPEFAELFKVAADFEEHMERSTENQQLYAGMIASTIHKESLLHLDKAAVARVIEHGARTIEDSKMFSLHQGDMTDLLRESSYWARKDAAKLVTGEHVQRALTAREQRVDRMRGLFYQQIKRDITRISVSGERIGQVNALSVLTVGAFDFAQPSRLTANCRFGDGDILDIEREVELGGDIHTKGVLILSGYLGTTYAKNKALSMSASLVFEQSYGEVDGDSATLAELCALLSAIAEVPIKQSMAITGSMNQHGEAQAIGGVNEKIEGFFDVCQLLDKQPGQGVIIPRSNIQHLMLRSDVIEAVEKGDFHIHAIDTVEQALALLTGLPVGELNEQGEYPTGSFNAAVAARIQLWEEVHKHEKESASEDAD
ncbi:ATP-dependent protease [Methylophaga sp. 41_12_T18]|nr:ATP-dependent protease [Methylophaga sp. 41_12_T18]